MDARDFWGSFQVPYTVDASCMKLTWNMEDEDEPSLEVTCKYEVCSLCEGKGSHVNPSIDAHGITESERAEWDPDEWERYRTGGYDVCCYQCQGQRVVPVIDEERNPPDIVAKWHKKMEEHYADARAAYRERMMGY